MILAVVVGVALAGAGDPAQMPIELTADGGLNIDLSRRIGRAEGHVVIKRQDLVVCCDRAEAHYGAARIEQVVCRGRVVMHRVDGTWATAEQVEFQAAKNRVVLTGAVVVARPDGRLSGSRVTYDLGSERVEVTGPRSTLQLGDAVRPPPQRCPRPVGRRSR